MEQMIATLDRTLETCGRLALDLSERFVTEQQDSPVGALGMTYNHVVLCRELIGFYYEEWGKPEVIARLSQDRELAVRENGQRLKEVTKWAFTAVLSGIEFHWKEADRKRPTILGLDHSNRIYIKQIVRKAHGMGLINATDYERWLGLVKLRDSLVHNNGLADEGLYISLPSIEIELKAGEPGIGKIRMFADAIEWCAGAHADWCGRFLLKAGCER